MSRLRPAAAAFAAMLIASPVAAHDVTPEDTRPLPFGLEDALDRMMDELKPALSDLMGVVKSFEGIDDPRNYTMPEVLPNGDIIIRRRDDAPAYRAPGDGDPDLRILPPRDPQDESKT